MQIRPAVISDADPMWEIFRSVVAGGDTYVFAPETPRDRADEYWFAPGVSSYVACDGETILGMYKIVANQPDLGSHVANASFMVDPNAAGRGIGKQLGRHSLKEARRLGFSYMQFNFVVSSNEAAVGLWKSLGFSIVGTLPRAFLHSQLGYVDVFVMYRSLEDLDA